MSDEFDKVNQRTFLLTLSPQEGQEIAEMAGFSPPSPDVQEQENIDVMGKWFTLSAVGLMEDIIQSATWMSDIIKFQNNLGDEEVKTSISLFTSFGVSFLTMLLDSDKISVKETLPLLIPVESMEKIISVINLFTKTTADDLLGLDEYDDEDNDD